jgi:hypothetical protein
MKTEWTAFDPALPILTCTYSFGSGLANALAVGVDGGVAVVSPPCRIGDDLYDALARHGGVKALIAPNAFHTMGIAPWRARFPGAAVFAPAQSIARVARVSKVADIRPLAEAAALAGPLVEFVEMPHYRSGEALVRMRSERGTAWFMTDAVLNLPKLPPNPIAKLMFGLSGSAPGLKFNNVAGLIMMRDKRALKRWLAQQIDADPPRWLLPCHGQVVDLGANAEPLRRILH